jgi:hypothetical protein
MDSGKGLGKYIYLQAMAGLNVKKNNLWEKTPWEKHMRNKNRGMN